MALGALVTSPLLKSALELLLPIAYDAIGGGKNGDKLVSRIQLKALEVDEKTIEAQSSALKAELSGSWIQRSWRPISMFVFMALLVYQVVIVSIINAIYGSGTIPANAQLTSEIINVILWGMSGYIVGRSGEKITKTIMEKRVTTAPEDGMRPPPVPEQAEVIESPFLKPDR